MKGVYFNCIYPKYCTNCGNELNIENNQYTKQDFNAKCSHTCNCGIQFIRVNEDEDLAKELVNEMKYYR